jgi:4-hydroxy-3-polyprenylbenzoate decarboxylase
VKASTILIDATRKWDYPPLSLPKKEYMEKAQVLWQELALPAINLKSPWFGYDLGYWGQEDVDDAARALAGKHYQTGELRKAARVRI